jgi:hypothetical protein
MMPTAKDKKQMKCPRLQLGTALTKSAKAGVQAQEHLQHWIVVFTPSQQKHDSRNTQPNKLTKHAVHVRPSLNHAIPSSSMPSLSASHASTLMCNPNSTPLSSSNVIGLGAGAGVLDGGW